MEENNVVQNDPPQTQQPVENQNQAPPSSKSKLPLILIIFIFIVVLFSGAYYLLNQTKNTNQPKQVTVIPTIAQNSPIPTIDETANPAPNGVGANWKTYVNTKENYSFKYPEYISINSQENKITLSNNLKVSYETLKPETVTVDNFNLSIETKIGTLKAVSSDTYLEGKKNLGNNTFDYAVSGAEGIGITSYYISRNNNDWVVFSRFTYLDYLIADNIKNNQSYLNSEKQSQLTDKILSTFRFAN